VTLTDFREVRIVKDYEETILQLVAYELWANFKLLDFIEGLSVEERNRDFGFGLRTPHKTIVHIAKVMQGWSGCVGTVIQEPSWDNYDQPASLSDVRTIFESVAQTLPVAAKAAHRERLLGEQRRLNHVFHIVTHGTHHRGQLLSMITLMGYDQPFEGGDFGGWSKENL
jgi:uncharacterized damage-inducible protein DinB